MTDVALSAATWREIAQFWRRLGELSHISFERSLRRAAAGLQRLLDGCHVLVVIQRRVESESSMGGFHPLFSRDFGPDVDTRLELTRQWAAHEPRLVEDPVLLQTVAGAGTLRVVRHRADTSPEQWAQAPVRRLLEQLKLEDRMTGVVPVGENVEVSFCVDRPMGEPIFDDVDRDTLLAAIEGLEPLAAKFVRCHGLMPGQRSLDPSEHNLVALLLSQASEAEIAESFEAGRAELEQSAAEIYEKLNVESRLELMHLWIYGGDEPGNDGLDGDEPADLSAAHLELPPHPASQSPMGSGPLIARVREAIDRALIAGEFDIEAVANDLGVSVRALQRDLRQTQTSFRELVEDGRRNQALLLLSRPWLNFTEIAFQLGYSQVSSFNRAVKRWTDSTPSQLREELLDEG
jgi:AraC-like DNA-binding protein